MKTAIRVHVDRQRVLKMVLAAGLTGVSKPVIARTLKLSNEVTSKHLQALASQRLIERSHDGGQACAWGVPGIRAKAEADAACRAALRRRNAEARNAARDRRVSAENWGEARPLQRVVPASMAAPLRVTGPSSVWGLACQS